jgi:hypothetical protein
MQVAVEEEMLDLLDSEGESITILRNVGNCSPNDRVTSQQAITVTDPVMRTSGLTNTIPLSTVPTAMRDTTANFCTPPTNVWHSDLNAIGFGLV